MQLKPLSEILALSKEKLDEAMAPIRARQVKAKADLESSKLSEKLVTLERQIHEACSKSDIDFAKVCDLMDEVALTERRIQQLGEIVAQLFPETKKKS
jgi:hypothetical protein